MAQGGTSRRSGTNSGAPLQLLRDRSSRLPALYHRGLRRHATREVAGRGGKPSNSVTRVPSTIVRALRTASSNIANVRHDEDSTKRWDPSRCWRTRFEGEHRHFSWPCRRDEAPRVSYAPSEYQTKRWLKEARIERWFPRLAGEQRSIDAKTPPGRAPGTCGARVEHEALTGAAPTCPHCPNQHPNAGCQSEGGGRPASALTPPPIERKVKLVAGRDGLIVMIEVLVLQAKPGRGGSHVDPETETSRWNPVGNQPHPAQVGHQPEASLAWPYDRGDGSYVPRGAEPATMERTEAPTHDESRRRTATPRAFGRPRG